MATVTNELLTHTSAKAAAALPLNDPVPVITFQPVVLNVPDRAVPMQVKITTPATSSAPTPILLLSHGQGRSNYLSSLHGYNPVSTFFAAHGFTVIQPTHLSSRSLSLPPSDEAPLYWKSRPSDMIYILDHLDALTSQFPLLQNRLDTSRTAVVGHSMGGHTAGMLLGLSVTDPASQKLVDRSDSRVKAGIILAGPGGQEGVSQMVHDRYPFFIGSDFSTLSTPLLVMAGDADIDKTGHLNTRGDASWHMDPYHLAPGAESLVVVKGGGHGLGGVSGWDTLEADDDTDPDRLEGTLRMAWAWIWTKLYGGEEWAKAREWYPKSGLGSVQEKR